MDRLPDEHGVLLLRDRGLEGVEEGLHRPRADLGHDEAEGGLPVGAGAAEDAAPLEAPVLTARRAAAAAPPAMAEPALPADPHLVLETERDPLVRMGLRSSAQPAAPFSKRRRAASSVFGCVGRTFCP